jgi:HK97 family phage portal protein
MRPKDILDKLFQPISLEPSVPITSEENTETTSKYFNFLPIGGGQPLESRLSSMSSRRIKKMSNQDPVIWSIKKTRKDQVTQQKWDIVPDLDKQFADLDRWEQIAKRNLNKYGFVEEFKPIILSAELVTKIQTELDKRMKDSEDDLEAVAQIKFLFEMIHSELKQDAEIHRCIVKESFNRPNNTQTSFEAFLKLVVDDLLTFDAGIIVKNKNRAGTTLAEMYTLPGQDIKLIKNKDGSTPEPPADAYVYRPTNSSDIAKFTNDELIYIVDNPQHTGYGMSPIEVAVLIITASLYAENYNLDFLKHSNIPPGILNLGKGLTEERRQIFQALWDAEIAGKGGLHKLMFAAGSDHMEMIPMKQLSNKDMEMMEYLKWTLSIKCMCYSISPQDIGFTQDFHRTTAEVQKELSKSRGLKNILSLLQSYINSEIVKTEWDFTDVKFKWLDVDLADALEQSKIDTLDLRNGVISINERRKNRDDSKPIEGGDEHFVYTAKGVFTSVEDAHKEKQIRIASQAGELDEENEEEEKEEEEKEEDPNSPQTQPNKQSSQQQGKQQKVEKYNNHTDSYVVNAGHLIHTMDEFEKTLKDILEEE